MCCKFDTWCTWVAVQKLCFLHFAFLTYFVLVYQNCCCAATLHAWSSPTNPLWPFLRSFRSVRLAQQPSNNKFLIRTSIFCGCASRPTHASVSRIFVRVRFQILERRKLHALAYFIHTLASIILARIAGLLHFHECSRIICLVSFIWTTLPDAGFKVRVIWPTRSLLEVWICRGTPRRLILLLNFKNFNIRVKLRFWIRIRWRKDFNSIRGHGVSLLCESGPVQSQGVLNFLKKPPRVSGALRARRVLHRTARTVLYLTILNNKN